MSIAFGGAMKDAKEGAWEQALSAMRSMPQLMGAGLTDQEDRQKIPMPSSLVAKCPTIESVLLVQYA
jgi:hypothetical protein